MMTNILRNKYLTATIFVVLLMVTLGGLWWVNYNYNADTFYPADLAERGYFEIETEGGAVVLGDRSTSEVFEASVDLVRDANSGLAISYDVGENNKPVVEDNLVK